MLMLDTECFSDYFLVSMLNLDTGMTLYFELHDDSKLDTKLISGFLKSDTIVTFNGNNYDIPLLSAALAGYDNAKLKALSDSIIGSKLPSWSVLRNHKFTLLKLDHIDLFDVAIGQSSLKIYGGRLHAAKMQDLPIEPSASIAASDRPLLREYCENDLHTTALLFNELRPQIELRAKMSKQYGMDLRSKSDAQIAEKIILDGVSRVTGTQYSKTVYADNATFKYIDPQIVSFKSDQLNDVLDKILAHRFTLGGNGAVCMPDWLRDAKIRIGDTEYQMGIGGLHSCEKSKYFNANSEYSLFDMDVSSYYPSIILQQRLAPKSMGAPFLKVYQGIVTRRLAAKKAGDSVTADVLKIAVNGSFGKLGSKYSALFAPELLIQTTITGQLCLLMLIERIEGAGARVVSANTDGVVIYCRRDLEHKCKEVAFDWELDTSFTLERTDYKAIGLRDVNNYVAVKQDGKTKGKGVFAPESLAKNPDRPIVATAVAQLLSKGTPIEQTIKDCKDITQFVTIRRVQGGAVWRDEKLGKAVRFYHSNAVHADQYIHYATNSNRVPNSAGTRPLMQLPAEFPKDVYYAYYIAEAKKLLGEVGC
jgi:hypothetical protein